MLGIQCNWPISASVDSMQKSHITARIHITTRVRNVRVRSCKTFHQLSVYYLLTIFHCSCSNNLANIHRNWLESNWFSCVCVSPPPYLSTVFGVKLYDNELWLSSRQANGFNDNTCTRYIEIWLIPTEFDECSSFNRTLSPFFNLHVIACYLYNALIVQNVRPNISLDLSKLNLDFASF